MRYQWRMFRDGTVHLEQRDFDGTFLRWASQDIEFVDALQEAGALGPKPKAQDEQGELRLESAS